MDCIGIEVSNTALFSFWGGVTLNLQRLRTWGTGMLPHRVALQLTHQFQD